MLRVQALLSFFLLLFPLMSAQNINILHQEDIMTEIKKGLSSTYNYQFDQARRNLDFVKKKAPNHPATVFLESLIIYWENYPMTPDNPSSAKFLSLVKESYTRAEKMLLNDPDNLEGIFFDLFGKALYVMYMADIGRPAKVFPYLNMLYRQTIKGFELQDSFNEFTFTTGLYNYYIVAYPENHLSYRAVALLFHKGDKEYGIRQLDYCARNSIFLRVEAKLYLTLINLKYENNFRKASEYASELYREFPNNYFFTALYAEVLMLDKKFPVAEAIIRKLEKSDNPYAIMNGHIFRGWYQEKHENKFEEAYREYKRGLDISLNYGNLTSYEASRAYMGIGRYYQRKGRFSEASKNFRAARGLTSYEFILNDK